MCDPAWGPPEGIYGGRDPARQAAVSSALLVGLARRIWQRNYGLFRRLLRAFDALGQCGRQLGDGINGFGRRAPFRIEAVLERIDQRGADYRAIGLFGNGARRLRRADAETDAYRELGMPLDARDRVANGIGVRRRCADDAGDRDIVDKA